MLSEAMISFISLSGVRRSVRPDPFRLVAVPINSFFKNQVLIYSTRAKVERASSL
jgi:hypothetical protein